jgi:hypothetical protein
LASTSLGIALTVGAGSRVLTTTSITSSANPSFSSVPFTLTISVAGAGGVPSGTVTVYQDLQPVGTVSLSGGQATFATTLSAKFPLLGDFTFKAIYTGDVAFAPSESAPLAQSVVRMPTSTALAVSPSPSVLGQPVTFTATVSATPGGVPFLDNPGTVGRVFFYDGATNLGSSPIDASTGVAIFTTSALGAGAHTITAQFQEGRNHLASTSVGINTPVTGTAQTATSLRTSPNPSSFGQPVTLTANVVMGASPSGTVTFRDGSSDLGTVALSAASTATLSTSALAAGTRSLTAFYNGTATFAFSRSFIVLQVVTPAIIDVTNTILPGATVGSSYSAVTLTASGGASPYVFSATGLPTGLTLNSSTGVISGSPTQSGNFTVNITATDSTPAASGGPFISTPKALTLAVAAGRPAWRLVTAANPTSFNAAGQMITFTNTVTNTGTVAISDISISGIKTGSCTIASLAVGATAGCVLSYTTVAADVGANIDYTATASGTAVSGILFPALSSGSVAYSALPSWTLATAANPTSFMTAGQTISYTHMLKNTGNVPINTATVSGPKVGLCIVASLAVGATATCASNYMTAAADIGANIAYTATATGTPTGGTLASASVSGTITYVAQPSWTLASVASPSSFSAVGQAITFAHTLTNTGQVPITSISVTGDKTGTCLVASLAAGATATCTSTYATQAADLGNNIAFTATATGTPAGGTLQPAKSSGSVTITVRPAVSAQVSASPNSVSQAGQVVTITYVLINTGNVTLGEVAMLDDRLGTMPCSPSQIAIGASTTCRGTLTVTTTDLQAGGISLSSNMTGIVVFPPALAASAALARSAKSAATTPITIQVKLQVQVQIAVDVAAIQQATRSAIQGLLSQRGNLLTTTAPDSARIHGRLSGGALFGTVDADSENSAPKAGLGRPSIAPGNGSAFGGGGLGGNSLGGGSFNNSPLTSVFDRFGNGAANMRGTNRTQEQPWPFGVPQRADGPNDTKPGALPFQFNGSADDGAGRFAFSASLSQFRAAAEQKERDKLAVASGLGLTPGNSSERTKSRPAAADVWIEGTSSYFTSDRPDGKRSGNAMVIMFGADYLVRPGLLVGMMAQFDRMGDSAKGTQTLARDGRGWMAGPYIAARLTPNLYFDMRAAWGTSTNHVDPLGAWVDTFSTTRALASAKLTGDWSLGNFRFRPSTEVIWFNETAKTYTNSIGIDIAGQTFSMGRLMFGPEIGYKLQMPDKSVFEPFIGLKGVWDFARTQETTAVGAPLAAEGIHGRVEAGASLQLPSGISIRATGAYDGIGSMNGYRAIQGKAQVSVPLQ